MNRVRMKLEPTRPQDARRDLRALWRTVAVYSCADGTLRIEPMWHKRFKPPGVLTRMHSAYLVQALLAMPRKRIDWRKRADAASPKPQPRDS